LVGDKTRGKERGVSVDVQPRPGQVWKDNDPRIRADHGCDRLVRITSVDDDGRATCEAWYEKPGERSRTVRIRLSRFKPTSTGYAFVRDEGGAS
jgi:hypothetical protein